MFKALLGLLGGGKGEKTPIGGLAWEIREAIKGKELDPKTIIELQSEINKVEAQHRSIFVSGWRPFTGWVIAFALAYNFVLRDLFIWALQPENIPPALQMDHLMTILLGMLGLGGMRSFEKIKDKTR